MIKPWSVPKMWPDETAVIIGGGPSLTMGQINYSAECGAKIIGINDAYRLAPWMDLHYSCSYRWWLEHYKQCRPRLSCKSITTAPLAAQTFADLTYLIGEDLPGLSIEPTVVHTGWNSGYQAINLCVHLGVKTIILIGFDMRVNENGSDHWFGRHWHQEVSDYKSWFPVFETLKKPLEDLDIEVINCTPGSALPTFRLARLEDVL